MTRIPFTEASPEEVRPAVEHRLSILDEYAESYSKEGLLDAVRDVETEFETQGHVSSESLMLLHLRSEEFFTYAPNPIVQTRLRLHRKNLHDLFENRQGLGIELDRRLGEYVEKTAKCWDALGHAADAIQETNTAKTHFFVLVSAFILLKEGLHTPLRDQLHSLYMSHTSEPEDDWVTERVCTELSVLNGRVSSRSEAEDKRKDDMQILRNCLAHGDYSLEGADENLRIHIEDPGFHLSLGMTIEGFHHLVTDLAYLLRTVHTHLAYLTLSAALGKFFSDVGGDSDLESEGLHSE